MPSKEFHETRIKELEFQRDVKRNKDNQIGNYLFSSISVVAILIIHELEKNNSSAIILDLGYLLLIVAVIATLIVVWAKYKEDKKIQRNYDELLGRNKK